MKKTLKSFGIKSLAALLSVLMILTALPLSAFAIGLESSDYSSVDHSFDRLSEAFEVVELRDESVKHFRLEDGSYVAAQYDAPVHYLDENGEWQDIDNSLSDNGSEYSTTNARIKFAKKITGNENLFTLHDGNYKITMSLDNAIKKTQGKITNAEDDPENESKLQKMMMLENLTSEIIYEDILSNVDLQYIINSGNIKENLIVKERQDAYSYTFTVKLNNLDAKLNENGSVSIFDPNTEEVIYFIPAPIVHDANGEYADSSCSMYSLEAIGNNTYALTVDVDSAWMNADDRAFPVTIDPPIYIPSGSTVTDTYINSYSVNSDPYDFEYMYAGNTTQLYWKTSALPALPNDAYITNADFSLRILAVPEGTYDSYMGAFQVTTNWDNSLTWNDYIASSPKGDYDLDGYTDFSVVSVTNNVTESTWLTWNITSIVKNWYAGQPNYGVTISDINRGTEGYSARNIQFASNDYSITVRLRPKLVISYKDMKGIEDYWTTTSQNAGIAGAGHVNNATGDLSFTIGTLSTTDSLMPYTPTLTYNAAIADYTNIYSNSEVPYLGSTAGYGFKWSMNESIVERTYMGENDTEVTYYVWSDADGTEHYFTPCLDEDGNTVYKDEDGLQMTLAVNTSSYTITDSSKTVRTFTRTTSDSSYMKAGGVLSKITDVSGNYISFNPNTWGRNPTISLVPYGSSSITSFKIIHNASGKINRILNESSQEAAIFYYSTTYNGTDISPYNGGYLRKIVYAHQTGSTLVDNWADFMENGSNSYITVDATATYSYDSTGRLIKARDELSDYEVNYGYTNGKVTSITEKAGSTSLTTGQQILLSYYDNYTEVRTSGTDDIINTSDDIITRYVFDNSGRTITAYSMDVNGTTIYGASSGQFNKQDESKNSIRVSSYVSDSAANYLMTRGFENSTAMNYWYISGTASRSTTAKYAGKYGATISATSGVTSSIYQYAKLTKGAYTLSLNINTNNCDGATVKLIAKSANNTFTEVVPVDEYAASGAYAFASLNFDVTATSENYQIIIQITGSKSTAQTIMVDNVMLAKSVGVSAYNMVELGNFEDCCLNASGVTKVTPEIRWTRSDTTYVTVGAPDVEAARFGESLKIVGSLDSARSASLNVFNASSSTDLKTPKIYKISGFAKANKQMSNSLSKFALKIDVTYYNQTEPETFWFDFANTPANQWQFISGTFDVCSDGGAVKTIKVSCVYDYQSGLGTAYFDNISVVEVRDGSAESYTYYESGMPKTYDNGNYKEWYFYADDNTSTNLTRKITSTNGVTDYTFDSKDRIISEVYYEYEGEYTGTLPALDPQVKTTYTYNSYGLITNTTIRTVKYSGSTLVDTSPANIISTTTNYNVTSGSRIFGSVASEVDSLGRTTRYFYDSNNGQLKFVVNPDQSSGMAYTYDGSGNLTLVEPVTYSSSTPSANTNAESVQYVYSQDRLTQIKTESTTYNLSYDVFGNNTKVQAGNNTIITATYNSRNGKVASKTYGNGLVVRYVYDELDRISEIWYTINGIQTKAYSYEYDASGNMCKFNDHANNRVFQYKYDDQNRMTGFIESSGNTNLASTVTTYDEQSRIHTISHSQDYALTSSSANLVTKYTYNYNDKNNLSEMTLTSGSVSYRFVPSYDALERVNSRTTSMTTASGTVTNTLTYGFTSSGTNRSLQVAQLVSKVGSNSTTYNYTYDANGNITKITDASGVIQYQYQYDDLGQLTREDNKVLGKSYVYTYDNAGNILSRKTYAFTTGTLGSVQSTISYTYGNSSWKDLLTNITGDGSITYDSIGNPTSIGGVEEFTWEGRQLASYYDGEYKNITFGYNDTGSRIFKEITDDDTGEVTRHEYTLNGTQIVKETVYVDGVESYTLIYLYDESEAPVGIRYRARSFASGVFNDYLFEKNLQGDIVAIYNQSGSKIATYNYDAWGKTTVSLVSSASTTDRLVANTYNPFRYRGYYYDTDLGMYYLGSRYYNQNWGRFLNADTSSVLSASPMGFTDKNLFAYCDNNPVARTDDGGEFWHIAIGAVVGAIGGAVSSIVSQAISGEKINWKAVGISAAGGAVSGAITAACPCMAPALVGVVEGTISAATYAATEKIAYGRNPSLKDTLQVGITSGVMAGGLQFVGQKLGWIQCFIAGTLVATKNGLVPIEDIEPGDLVWATDVETGETALKEVVQLFRNETEEWVHITVNGEKITCTPEHPFYVPQKGWTSAVDLRAGDILVMLNGEYVVVEQVQHELLETSETTYNFEVEDFHTYYVGINNVFTHNACGDNGIYEDASYHTTGNPVKSARPINGQAALDNSIQINPTSPRRIGTSNNQFVVLNQTSPGLYHGHVRAWGDLSNSMRSALIKAGKATIKGKIIG